MAASILILMANKNEKDECEISPYALRAMVNKIQRGLIVSCQAEDGSPFNAPEFMAAFAMAAELGHAVGVRVRDPENVAAVKKGTKLPVIGLTKGYYKSGMVLITPTIDDVLALIESGADIVALDATKRTRPGGMSGIEFLRLVKSKIKIPLVADISTVYEALAAADVGADFVATTLSGYTEDSVTTQSLPDFQLIENITSQTGTPVIAEGRIWVPEQARIAIDHGAYAVCVGTAITRPVAIIERFTASLSAGKSLRKNK